MPDGPFSSLIPDDLWMSDEMVEALRARDIRVVFQLVRRYGGASQTLIGNRVGMAQPEVSRIMTRRRMVGDLSLLERIADGLGMPDSARVHLGIAPKTARIEPAERDSAELDQLGLSGEVEAAIALWAADFERRRFLLDSTFTAAAFALPALRWLTHEQRPGPSTTDGGRKVGKDDVAVIEGVTATFRRMDNRHGGGHAREAVVTYLHTEVRPLIRDGRYSAETGSALYSAAAEMTRLAGWMAYDIDRPGLGQRCLVQALRLSTAAGNGPLSTEILAGMSHQAIHFNQAAEGVDLAQAAVRSAAQTGSRLLQAEAAVMAAHGYAVRGDEAACAAELRRAESSFEQADRADEPGWLGYFDRAYLSAKFAHCFHALGLADQAERYARLSLEMNESYVRGRMFNTALLATIQARRGELDQAVKAGDVAVSLAAELESKRTTRYLAGLRSELARHASNRAVNDFIQRSHSTLDSR